MAFILYCVVCVCVCDSVDYEIGVALKMNVKDVCFPFVFTFNAVGRKKNSISSKSIRLLVVNSNHLVVIREDHILISMKLMKMLSMRNENTFVHS